MKVETISAPLTSSGRAVEGKRPIKGRASILDSVNGVKTAFSAGAKCGNPVCGVSFEPSGMAISPKRFCSRRCRLDAWAIKRAAELLAKFSDAGLLSIMRGTMP